MNFSVIKKAKLSTREYAQMTMVSYPAVYNWIAGRTKPHALLRDRVERSLKLIELQIERGVLPMREGLSKDERFNKIEKLADTLASFKP